MCSLSTQTIPALASKQHCHLFIPNFFPRDKALCLIIISWSWWKYASRMFKAKCNRMIITRLFSQKSYVMEKILLTSWRNSTQVIHFFSKTSIVLAMFQSKPVGSAYFAIVFSCDISPYSATRFESGRSIRRSDWRSQWMELAVNLSISTILTGFKERSISRD